METSPVQPLVFFDEGSLPTALEGQRLLDARDALVAPAPAQAAPDLATLSVRLSRLAAADGGLGAFDIERTIGTSDLVGIHYLAAGLRAARPVARLLLVDADGQDTGFATGFLVGPRLLLTNAHVFPDADSARNSTAEFGFELDLDRNARPTARFALQPEELFLAGSGTDPRRLDFALVAVAAQDAGGGALADWGWLRLDGRTGKIDPPESITIIQHPAGEPKQVALRENRLLAKDDELGTLIYVTDTAPGSSGAPCFNDQWQVVALHSRGVPAMTDDGRIVLTGGRPPVTRDQLRGRRDLKDSDIAWVSNLGVRTSRIVQAIQASTVKDAPLVRAMLADMKALPGKPFGGAAPVAEAPVVATEAARRRRRAPALVQRRDFGPGYSADFLGEDLPVPFPAVTARALAFGGVAKNRETGDNLLTYQHFSIVMCAQRRLAFCAGINIAGDKTFPLERGRDRWLFDPRLPEDEQAGDWLYADEDAVAIGEASGNFFDRGHLVRRADACWGDAATARRGNDDTFHWTNCSPQHWSFNRGGTLWHGLEDFILSRTDAEDIRASVFNGPIFRLDDVIHRGLPIPREYWKVIVLRDRQGRMRSSAYVVSQARMLQQIDFEALPIGRFRTFQRPVARITAMTGLDFGAAVIEADAIAGRAPAEEESIGPADSILLRSFADIVL